MKRTLTGEVSVAPPARSQAAANPKAAIVLEPRLPQNLLLQAA